MTWFSQQHMQRPWQDLVPTSATAGTLRMCCPAPTVHLVYATPRPASACLMHRGITWQFNLPAQAAWRPWRRRGTRCRRSQGRWQPLQGGPPARRAATPRPRPTPATACEQALRRKHNEELCVQPSITGMKCRGHDLALQPGVPHWGKSTLQRCRPTCPYLLFIGYFAQRLATAVRVRRRDDAGGGDQKRGGRAARAPPCGDLAGGAGPAPGAGGAAARLAAGRRCNAARRAAGELPRLMYCRIRLSTSWDVRLLFWQAAWHAEGCASVHGHCAEHGTIQGSVASLR
jgi:hypothetical protein